VVLLTASLGVTKYSTLAGVLCLIPTFVGNGIHSTCAKLAGPGTSAFAYVFYLACGVFLSCTIIVAAMGQRLEVSGPGLLGGLLLGVSCNLGINAILFIGIVWSDMVVASVATLTAFLWGKLYFGEPSSNLGIALVGLVLLLLGIFGLSILLMLRLRSLGAEAESESEGRGSSSLPGGRELTIGLVCAICCGAAGGTSFPINKLQPADKQGASFVWAQSLGMVIAQAVITMMALGWDSWVGAGESEKAQPLVRSRWEARRLLPLALAQGAILAATNVTTTVAALSSLGVAVAQPVREAGHSLSVLIGSFAFREYGEPDHRFMGSLLACTAVEITGMILLILYGGA